MTTIINGSSPSITFSDGSAQTSATRPFLNRIINGAMVIDQRNAGASINNSTSGVYSVDRWKTYGAASAKFSIQQNAGSVTPPAGFVNYLGVTSLAATTPGSSDQYDIYQLIEGYNIADLNWGSANAKTVTLSFWVRSSLTGTFGGVLKNTAATRSYPFSYTISSANTWEYKTITATGSTDGTWETTTSTGIIVLFSMGGGSSLLGTAGAWASANYVGATGQTNVVATNGATFYLTGVQLEIGSTATSFDYRPYGTELALCQRYYQKSYEYSVVAGTSLADDAPSLVMCAWGYGGATNTVGNANASFQVSMRTNATVVTYDKAGTSGKISTLATTGTYTNNVTPNITVASQNNIMTQKFAQSCAGVAFAYTASAEL